MAHPAATAIQFRRNDWGQLLLVTSSDAPPVVVEPIRCFPLTHPDRHVALLDSEGKELCRITDLHELPAEQRALLVQELADREFTPVIQRIIHTGAALPCRWEVETDRGRTRFDVDSDDDVRKLADGTIIIADNDGVRYRISDVEALDAASRGFLRRFM